MINVFGETIKKERLKAGLSLREFCRKISYDASNWSKIERGKYSPPQDEEMLNTIAHVLNINTDSLIWKELVDKAHIDAGIIPPDILSDEEIVKALPLFFRTLRSEKPTEEELNNLIENIRREGI
jgi:transcriptional regulator with XRE-family HTH domain